MHLSRLDQAENGTFKKFKITFLESNGKFMAKSKRTVRVKNFLKDRENIIVNDLEICVNYTQRSFGLQGIAPLRGVQSKCCWSFSMQTYALSANHSISTHISFFLFKHKSMLCMHHMKQANRPWVHFVLGFFWVFFRGRGYSKVIPHCKSCFVKW